MNTMIVADSNLIYDTDINGGTDSNGQILQAWGSDALSNAILMWLISFKGDVIHDPSRGGYFTQWLFKPMIAKNIDKMKMAIRDGLEQDFIPKLQLKALDIVPNYTKRYWGVYMEVFSPALKLNATVDAKIKNRV